MFGLRAARHQFTHPTGQSVTLFPMVHVGERAFYSRVYEDACGHDVVLVEGVDSPVVKRLTRVYRWLDHSRLGLVVQPRHPEAGQTSARMVHADLSAEEFHRHWRQIPLWLRMLLSAAVPVMALRMRRSATRDSIAARLALEDRRSPEEILRWSPARAAFDRCILHARDERLLACLDAQLDGTAAAGARVAVVYGAAHMRAVLEALKRRGFRCVESSWMTVFHADE